MIINEILQWGFILMATFFNFTNASFINQQAKIIKDFFDKYYSNK